MILRIRGQMTTRRIVRPPERFSGAKFASERMWNSAGFAASGPFLDIAKLPASTPSADRQRHALNY